MKQDYFSLLGVSTKHIVLLDSIIFHISFVAQFHSSYCFMCANASYIRHRNNNCSDERIC